MPGKIYTGIAILDFFLDRLVTLPQPAQINIIGNDPVFAGERIDHLRRD